MNSDFSSNIYYCIYICIHIATPISNQFNGKVEKNTFYCHG